MEEDDLLRRPQRREKQKKKKTCIRSSVKHYVCFHVCFSAVPSSESHPGSASFGAMTAFVFVSEIKLCFNSAIVYN